MNGNRKILTAAFTLVAALSLLFAASFVLRECWLNRDYSVGEDEIALYIDLELNEDIGLIVFDYSADGRERSGGVSNADRTCIKKDDEIIIVWKKEELGCSADTTALEVRFRIITEYTDPNFENVYPEQITRRLEPVKWNASFGQCYTVKITGGKETGYTASVSKKNQEDRNG